MGQQTKNKIQVAKNNCYKSTRINYDITYLRKRNKTTKCLFFQIILFSPHKEKEKNRN